MNGVIMKMFLLISITALLILLPAGCQPEPAILYTYQIPESIDAGLDVGSLDEVNIEVEIIEKAVNDINRGKFNEMHSLLIFKADRLVFEEYFAGHKYDWNSPDFQAEL